MSVFMDLATSNCKFFEVLYGTKDLYAMNWDGVEVSFEVFETHDTEHFCDVTDTFIDHNDPRVDFGITSLFLVPRQMFESRDKNDEAVVTNGILAALKDVGMDGLLTKEEIDAYIHGQCPIDEFADGFESVMNKIKIAFDK